MEIVGYIVAALIGVSLGLIGAGGSVLTVPVMVYLFSVEPVQATSYSLFVVGAASAIGAYSNFRKGQVAVKTAFLIAVFSVATVYLTRKYIVPRIPKSFGTIAGYHVTESSVLMILFALLMFAVSVSMIRGRRSYSPVLPSSKKNIFKLSVYGIGIGLVTGLLGVGGGFLLIPALVFVVGLGMKEAVGTSLFIIALNSLIGFIGDIGHFKMDWLLLFRVTGLAIAGILAGHAFSRRIDAEKLKKIFGWFVMTMSLWIMAKEIFLFRRLHT